MLCRLEQHERERGRVEVENDNLKQKLRALCEQYEARDSHYHQQVYIGWMLLARPCQKLLAQADCTRVILLLQLQTKELELKMATMKLQDHAALLKQADIHQRQLSESLDQASRSKEDTDKMLASYNDRFAECQSSIEKSNEVSGQKGMHLFTAALGVGAFACCCTCCIAIHKTYLVIVGMRA